MSLRDQEASVAKVSQRPLSETACKIIRLTRQRRQKRVAVRKPSGELTVLSGLASTRANAMLLFLRAALYWAGEFHRAFLAANSLIIHRCATLRTTACLGR